MSLPTVADKRKELWALFEKWGIPLSNEQHDEIKAFLVEYADLKNEILVKQVADMLAASAKRKEAARLHNARKGPKRKPEIVLPESTGGEIVVKG